jgi:hypothetical protein
VCYVSVWLSGLGFLAGAACKNGVMTSKKGSLISHREVSLCLHISSHLARYNISLNSGEDHLIGFNAQIRLMKAFCTRAQKVNQLLSFEEQILPNELQETVSRKR